MHRREGYPLLIDSSWYAVTCLSRVSVVLRAEWRCHCALAVSAMVSDLFKSQTIQWQHGPRAVRVLGQAVRRDAGGARRRHRAQLRKQRIFPWGGAGAGPAGGGGGGGGWRWRWRYRYRYPCNTIPVPARACVCSELSATPTNSASLHRIAIYSIQLYWFGRSFQFRSRLSFGSVSKS